MKEIKVDKDSFYEMMENLFNSIYEPLFVVKCKREYGFTRKGEYFTGKLEEYSLFTKENKYILSNVQMKQGIKYNEMITNKEGTTFDTSFLTIEEIKEMVKEEVLEYHFLAKIPEIMISLGAEENIQDGKIFISDELSTMLCENFKKYVRREKNAERYLEIDIYDDTHEYSKRLIKKYKRV